MKSIYLIICLILLFFCHSCEQKEERENDQTVVTTDLIRKTFAKGREHCNLDFYAGTLMLHGMSEFALLSGNESYLDSVVHLFQKFSNGEINAKGNFITYKAGGTGAAYLSWKGVTSKLDQQVFEAADLMMRTQKRTHDNLMTAPNLTHEMFIDVVFTVSPFLLYAGLKFDKPEWVDYAVFQTLESFRILHDDATGLVHQGRGFQGEGVISEDCWSRGNGWGAFALAILARDLPEDHPKRKDVEELAIQFFTAVLAYQNEQGLWHQEMTAPESYVETSGSGLLLYGLGVALEKGLLPKKYLKNFENGVRSYLSYMGSDGSVSHCAFSCRCPGDGSKEVYINHPWVYNDHHAFGPAILTLVQAAKVGYTVLTPQPKIGEYSFADSPDIPRTYIAANEQRSLNWENDRIAFRVYGPAVREKVGSGVDVWAKSVDYSIIDRWYRLNGLGQDYHVDRGEGLDFYNVGKRSGSGGLSIWIDGKPVSPSTYDRFRIIRNQLDELEFDLYYTSWEIPGMELKEKRKISMENGKNLFEVSTMFSSKENKEIIIALGLSTFGDANVTKNQEEGLLSVWEHYKDNGHLGTAVMVDPSMVIGFDSYEGDEFMLIKARTNEPISYRAGAAWDGSGQFSNREDWEHYLKSQTPMANEQ